MIVVALDGFGGRRKREPAVTELVPRALAAAGLESAQLVTGRGGSGLRHFRRIHRQVVQSPEKTLVCIGKSYGAHWCLRLLWKLYDSERAFYFRSIGLLTFDPSYVLHRMQRRIRPAPPVDYGVNVHQFGRRSGYRLSEPVQNVAIRGSHKTIEATARARVELDRILRWAREVDQP